MTVSWPLTSETLRTRQGFKNHHILQQKNVTLCVTRYIMRTKELNAVKYCKNLNSYIRTWETCCKDIINICGFKSNFMLIQSVNCKRQHFQWPKAGYVPFFYLTNYSVTVISITVNYKGYLTYTTCPPNKNTALTIYKYASKYREVRY